MSETTIDEGEPIVVQRLDRALPSLSPPPSVSAAAAVSHRNVVQNGDDTNNTIHNNSGTETTNSGRKYGPLIAPVPYTVTILCIVLGMVASGVFVALGVHMTLRVSVQYKQVLTDLSYQLDKDLNRMEFGALWAYQSQQAPPSNRRRALAQVHPYLRRELLELESVAFLPRVDTWTQRQSLEAEARAYYREHWPEAVDYAGFSEQNSQEEWYEPRSNQTVYYPAQNVEPVEGNQGWIGFDYYSVPDYRDTIELALEMEQPRLTSSRNRCDEGSLSSSCRAVVQLIHPGADVTEESSGKNVVALGLDVTALLAKAVREQVGNSVAVTLHEVLQNDDDDDPENSAASSSTTTTATTATTTTLTRYMTGIEMLANHSYTLLPEKQDLEHQYAIARLVKSTELSYGGRQWKITVWFLGDAINYGPDFMQLGGVFLLISFMCLAFYIVRNNEQIRKTHQEKQQADRARAQQLIDSAQESALAERKLNDFIAHEVRNPIAAAIAAGSFVSSEIAHKNRLDAVDLKTIREDIHIMNQSLDFVNNLLRDMLDMHRASSFQINIELSPTRLLEDVLKPVGSMLYKRDMDDLQVMVDCPTHLTVMTDGLRLKQIVLNMGLNALQFTKTGFVRVRAETVDQNVRILVEDSGPGISPDTHLFSKYDYSLGVPTQGTGVGCCLAYHLCQLLQGDLSWDETYHSGDDDHPGSRFVIILPRAPWNPPSSSVGTSICGAVSEEEEVIIVEPQHNSNHSRSNGDDSPLIRRKSKDFDDDDNNNSGQTNSCSLSTEEQKESPMPPADVVTTSSSQRLHGLQFRSSSTTTVFAEELSSSFMDVNEDSSLPDHLRLLFVDDDVILRKLFSRSVRTIAPGWSIDQAESGETALEKVEETTYDLIFMDQYMSKSHKQLLGSEATAALRQRGCRAIICGLSANNVVNDFELAGADAFMMKPLPTDKSVLRKKLSKLILSKKQQQQ